MNQAIRPAMDTAANAQHPVVDIPTKPGTPWGGGFYLGRVFVGPQAFALVVAPKAEGEHKETVWHDKKGLVAGATSAFDGLADTDAMAEAGSALAKWARDLRIGGYDDWHLPSRQDLLVIYGNEGDAGEAFAKGGAEAFERGWYWSSMQDAEDPESAWCQSFRYGLQSCHWKADYTRARAVRRVPITR